MIARIDRGFLELIDDAIGRGIGGVAHAQVDDVDARHPLVVLHLVDAAEQIRRQALDARRDVNFEWLVHGGPGSFLVMRDFRIAICDWKGVGYLQFAICDLQLKAKNCVRSGEPLDLAFQSQIANRKWSGR